MYFEIFFQKEFVSNRLVSLPICSQTDWTSICQIHLDQHCQYIYFSTSSNNNSTVHKVITHYFNSFVFYKRWCSSRSRGWCRWTRTRGIKVGEYSTVLHLQHCAESLNAFMVKRGYFTTFCQLERHHKGPLLLCFCFF